MTEYPPPELLTPEQIDILNDLADGLTYKQIALAKGKRPLTISRMMMRARTKLGAETCMHMMALFILQYKQGTSHNGKMDS